MRAGTTLTRPVEVVGPGYLTSIARIYHGKSMEIVKNQWNSSKIDKIHQKTMKSIKTIDFHWFCMVVGGRSAGSDDLQGSREGRTKAKRTPWHAHSVVGGCYDRQGPPCRSQVPSRQPQQLGHFKTLNLLWFLTTIKKQNYMYTPCSET